MSEQEPEMAKSLFSPRTDRAQPCRSACVPRRSPADARTRAAWVPASVPTRPPQPRTSSPARARAQPSAPRLTQTPEPAVVPEPQPRPSSRRRACTQAGAWVPAPRGARTPACAPLVPARTAPLDPCASSPRPAPSPHPGVLHPSRRAYLLGEARAPASLARRCAGLQPWPRGAARISGPRSALCVTAPESAARPVPRPRPEPKRREEPQERGLPDARAGRSASPDPLPRGWRHV